LKKSPWIPGAGLVFSAAALVGLAAPGLAGKFDSQNLLTGRAAFGDAASLKPGTFRKITAADLPEPFATDSSRNNPRIVPRPNNVWPQAPAGFRVDLYASQVNGPRKILTAPNGDFFVAASYAGEILVFRGRDFGGRPQQTSTFAAGLARPFGIAFYPPGPNPQWVYVGNTDSIVRFPYKNGDLKAAGPAQTVVRHLPSGRGHWTRGLVFSPDGKRLLVAVGSSSNVDDPALQPREMNRADILEYEVDGKFVGIYASGIRNPAGLAIQPQSGELWCSTNERDGLGDNLVPDYITRVQRGGFYGWPYFYIGGHSDPRLEGRHTELRDKVIIPDVLLTPHNASLALTFYDGAQFPAEYRGDLFAAEHGSWNRSVRSGYEVIRVPLENGHAAGVYEDFLTGFVLPNGDVWGRPVGVAVAQDGSLMVTDDGSGSIWRISYAGK